MPVRRTLAGRSPDGRELHVIKGDPLPWNYDKVRNAFWVKSQDGKTAYLVARPNPRELQFTYWAARVRIIGEGGVRTDVNLGDEYMVPDEGRQVCELYETARQQNKIEVMKKLTKQ